MASTGRTFRCWNCGSEVHKLSDCKKEVHQVNKNFWRKYFRLTDAHEKSRHHTRYINFLLRLDPTKDSRAEDWEGLTKEEIKDRLQERHLSWRKQQWETKQEIQESQVQITSGEVKMEEDQQSAPGSAGSVDAVSENLNEADSIYSSLVEMSVNPVSEAEALTMET